MKKKDPVKDYTSFVNESKMKVIKSSDLKHSWDANHPLNNNENPQLNAKSGNTPLLNLLKEHNYTVSAGLNGYSGKFGKDCVAIKVGNDLKKKYVFLITIGKLWTEEMVEDSYGDDWRNDEEAVATVGTPVNDGETFTYNFFTDYTNLNSPAFLEEALRYAQYFYKLYAELEIHSSDKNDLFSYENIVTYLNRIGVVIKSNNDIPIFIRTGYRAYQDCKAIYVAQDEFFTEDFLEVFASL